jgi:hypothetical protein
LPTQVLTCFFYYSILCLIDPRNYSQEKIDQDKQDVVDFVFHLLAETVSGKLQALDEESKDNEQTVFEQYDMVDDTTYGGDIVTQLLRKVEVSRRLDIDEEKEADGIRRLFKI